MITVGELRKMLRDYPADATVRIMSQPNWPMEYTICGVWEKRVDSGYDDEDGEAGNSSSEIFLVEGDQIGYGSKRAWEEMEGF